LFDGIHTIAKARLAHPGDAEALYACLLALEDDHALVPRDDARVRDMVRRACWNRGAAAGVIEQDGEIVATAGVILGDLCWYSEVPALREIWFYVRREYRRSGALADALWAWMEEHREQIGRLSGKPVVLLTGPTCMKRLAAKMRWWARRSKLVTALYMVGTLP